MSYHRDQIVPSQQTLEHLRMANHAKVARSRIKREIRQGKRTAASVIADPPDGCAKMPVMDVLKAQFRWGADRARRCCRDEQVQVYELRTLEALTRSQRERLIGYLKTWWKRNGA
jgi:hypothetical protein